MNRLTLASLTRITDLSNKEFEIKPLGREDWKHAHYVVGEMISGDGPYAKAELANGRLVDLMRGDRVMGALGVRAATLESCGDWTKIGSDLVLDQMTPAGLFGKETSRSYLLPPLPKYRYLGHVWIDGKPLGMSDFVKRIEPVEFRTPTILIIGTSMSAGKTMTARVVIRLLKKLGLKVVGAKLTGAGRYRDVLSMYDAGADEILDFVDVGLPSSVRPVAEFEDCLEQMLARIQRVGADVLVAEVGASPMEPYNGESVVARLKETMRMSILCASDPYAVKGVMEAFRFTPDLVGGPCTNTEASMALVGKLTGLPALNILDPDAPRRLGEMLRERLAPAISEKRMT